jgi:hypothetical protein
MNFPNTQIPITYEALMASIYETERVFKEKTEETERFLKEKSAESERIYNEKHAESERIYKEQLAESERIFNERLAKTDRYLSKKFAETDRLIKANSREIGGISKSNGEIAEEYFTNSFIKNLHFAGQEFDSLTSNLNKKITKINLQGEFDIVLYNCTSIAIIEVKYKAEKNDLEPLLLKPPVFKRLFPEYRNFKIYLGLAGLSMKKEVEMEAEKLGIAVIKQVGKTMIIHDEHLKVF